MDIRGKRIYISGAITNVPNYKSYFDDVVRYSREMSVSSFFNPASEIDEGATWDEAMWRCRSVLRSGNIDVMLVICNRYKDNSRGLKEEIDIAREMGIPIEPIFFTSWNNRE